MNKIVKGVVTPSLTVKVHVPYIRWIDAKRVLLGSCYHDAVLCYKNKLPEPPRYGITEGVVVLPPHIAREIHA